MEQIAVQTKTRNEFIDITSDVQRLITKSNVNDGICYLYVPHTTAGITINENADPSVVNDIKNHLNKIVPSEGRYTHLEGNADAHIKSTLVGCSKTIFVNRSKLVLGTWQGIFFCEFDGPRSRKVYAKIIPG